MKKLWCISDIVKVTILNIIMKQTFLKKYPEIFERYSSMWFKPLEYNWEDIYDQLAVILLKLNSLKDVFKDILEVTSTKNW